MTESPFTFAEARAAAHQASQRQVDGERARIEAATDHAAKELAYRKALAKHMTLVRADGVAWSAAEDLARGNPDVAQLRFERDVAAGVLAAAEQAGFRLNADRRILERLCEWSMRRELAEGGVA